MWRLTAIDVLKSHMLAKLSWQEGDLVLDATVKFQRNYIQSVGLEREASLFDVYGSDFNWKFLDFSFSSHTIVDLIELAEHILGTGPKKLVPDQSLSGV